MDGIDRAEVGDDRLRGSRQALMRGGLWREARQLEEGHPLHTVEDHCPQTHLSTDEGLDEAWVVRSDAETWKADSRCTSWNDG